MIDFVVMQLSDCRFCVDTQVMRVWSDHCMVRAKLHFTFHKAASQRTKRKQILTVHNLVCESVRKKYQEVLAEKFNTVKLSE